SPTVDRLPLCACGSRTPAGKRSQRCLGESPAFDLGLVSNLNRPGGNVTGVTFLTNSLGAKRLELLRELIPSVTAIGLLINPENSSVSRLKLLGRQRSKAETAAQSRSQRNGPPRCMRRPPWSSASWANRIIVVGSVADSRCPGDNPGVVCWQQETTPPENRWPSST